MSICFRNYKPKDKSELQEMILSLYREDPEGEDISLLKINKTIDVLNSHSEKGKLVVFEEQERIIGYGILIFYWSNEYGGDILSIDELYVKPEYRSRGYASSFMNHVFDRYKSKVKAFMLEVTPSNMKAYKYYKQLGFEEVINKHMIVKV